MDYQTVKDICKGGERFITNVECFIGKRVARGRFFSYGEVVLNVSITLNKGEDVFKAEYAKCVDLIRENIWIMDSQDIPKIVSLLKCKPRIKKIKIPKKVETKATQVVYLIKDSNTGLYKIGKSSNPLRREKTLQSEKPSIKMVKVFEEITEKDLHNQYSSFRVRGEWFNLSSIQVEYICRHNK